MYGIYRVTYNERDSKDDLKLFKYDDPKVGLNFLPFNGFFIDLTNEETS